MAWQAVITADTQAEFDEMKAWYLHAASCSNCQDGRILSMTLDEPSLSMTGTVESDALDWTIPDHGG